MNDGFNLAEYEGGKSNFTQTYTRRWQHVVVYNFLMSEKGKSLLGK